VTSAILRQREALSESPEEIAFSDW